MHDIALFLLGAAVGILFLSGSLFLTRLYKKRLTASFPPTLQTPIPEPESVLESKTYESEGESGFIRLAPRQSLPPDQYDTWQMLTPRETQVAECAARGLTNAEIARELGIKTGTVDKHLKQVYSKLDVRSRTQLANFVRDLAL